MFCPSCGKDIPDTSSFCLHCGKPLSTQSKPPAKSRRWPLYLIAVLAGIALLMVVISRLNTEHTSTLTPQPVSQKLFSGQTVVRAGQYVFVKFEVNATTMQNAHVNGSFHASGGTGNDIQAVLAEESEFENWKNGHQAKVLYSTPKTTNGKLDVAITEPGTYYMAFSNAFSVSTDKDVFAEIELTYLSPSTP